jgi:proteic killer suppression protein
VIRTIRHKGLRRFCESGSTSGIRSAHTGRLRHKLVALDTAYIIQDMDIPGFKLHPLKGMLKERWAIWVSGNWRLTFEFKNGDVYLLDYEDYPR